MSSKGANRPPAPWEALFDSDDLPRNLAALFDDAFLGQLAACVGPNADLADLRAGVEAVARAYLRAQLAMRRKKPAKKEHRRLERVADAAHELAEALDRTSEARNADLKLGDALQRISEGATGRGAHLLALARDQHGPGDPMRALREIAQLVAEAAAQTVDKRPGDPAGDWQRRAVVTLGRDLAAWEAGAHKYPPAYPLQAMAEAFRPFWLRNSDHPYTKGMHYREAGGTISPAVDALHLIACRLDPATPRSRVATALQRSNAARKSSPSDS